MRPFLLLATCLVSLPALAGAAHAKPKVVILGLEVTGQGATDEKAIDAAKLVTRELRREAGRPTGAFELAPDGQKDLLEIKMLSDCSDEGRRCMSDIGRDLGAERLIYGKLERRKGSYEVSLKLLDTETRELGGQTTDTITFEEVSDAAAMGRHGRTIYARLTGAPEEGSLDITANVERGSVYVDGEIKTTLSAGSARVSGLATGEHTIAIEAKGFARYETVVRVAVGEPAALQASLMALETESPGAERPGSGWRVAFWSGILVTGAAGAAWTYSGFKVLAAEDDVDSATEAYTGPPLEGFDSASMTYPNACDSFDSSQADGSNAQVQAVRDACDQGKSNRNLINYAFMPVTVAGALFSAFALYKGYIAPGKAASSERQARRGRRTKQPVVVTPTIGPGLLGAGLAIEF